MGGGHILAGGPMYASMVIISSGMYIVGSLVRVKDLRFWGADLVEGVVGWVWRNAGSAGLA